MKPAILRNVFVVIQLMTLVSCGRKTEETKPITGSITESVFASGSLEPHNRYNLTAQTEGYIVELDFDHGDLVAGGQVLALIDNTPNEVAARSAGELLSIAEKNASQDGPALSQAKQNIAMLRARRAQDSLLAARYSRLYEGSSASKVQMEQAQLAFVTSKSSHNAAVESYRLLEQQTRQALVQQRTQQQAASTAAGFNRMRAPFGGRVYKRLKEAGDYVRRGEVVAVIGDPSRLFARLNVDENSIGRVRPGQEVLISLNTKKDSLHKARVTKILPAFDEQTQSFICEAEFITPPVSSAQTDASPLFIAGTQLQANIITGKKDDALLIPRNFLSYRNSVMVKGKGERQITTGFVSGDWVEVLEGIDNETVIETEVVK